MSVLQDVPYVKKFMKRSGLNMSARIMEMKEFLIFNMIMMP